MDLTGPVEFTVGITAIEGRRNQILGHATPDEFPSQAASAKTVSLGADVGVGEAGIGEQPQVDQAIKLGVDFVLAAQPVQLAGQFEPRVFPQGQTAQGAFMQTPGHRPDAFEAFRLRLRLR